MERVRRLLGVGTWRPATLTSSDIITIKVALAVTATLHAADYGIDIIRGGDVVEQALPVGVWATICGLVAFLILAGMAARAHWALFAGHFLGAVTYLALSVGSYQHAFTQVPPDEWRRGGPLLVVALIHWMLAMRSGPTPITQSSATPAEVVVAPTEQ